jgi:hypothetical protein
MSCGGGDASGGGLARGTGVPTLQKNELNIHDKSGVRQIVCKCCMFGGSESDFRADTRVKLAERCADTRVSLCRRHPELP